MNNWRKKAEGMPNENIVSNLDKFSIRLWALLAWVWNGRNVLSFQFTIKVLIIIYNCLFRKRYIFLFQTKLNAERIQIGLNIDNK